MKGNKLQNILLIFLIIMNIFFLYNYLGKPDNRPIGQKGNPSDFIAKELQFNDSQLEKLKALDEVHSEKMMRTDEEIKELKDELFGNLSNLSVKPSIIDSLTTLIGVREKEKDMNVFSHFRKIQNICNENQKKRLEKILKDALRPQGQLDREGQPPPPRQ